MGTLHQDDWLYVVWSTLSLSLVYLRIIELVYYSMDSITRVIDLILVDQINQNQGDL